MKRSALPVYEEREREYAGHSHKSIYYNQTCFILVSSDFDIGIY